MISIKEIVKKYGIPYSTVNYYTMIGLLTVVDRKKNIRFYDETEVKERLARILELRSQGYPLHLIQKEFNNK
jgi:DNA-binding transcriptional MerR regulator